MMTPRARYRSLVEQVAREYGTTFDAILSMERTDKIVRARQDAMFRLRREEGCSSSLIGRLMQRDHSTVLHGVRAHEERIAAAGRGLLLPHRGGVNP